MSTPKPPEPRHIGDGVYVSFDGYHLQIAVNDHRNPVVAFEPAVLKELISFAKEVNSVYGQRHFPVE